MWRSEIEPTTYRKVWEDSLQKKKPIYKPGSPFAYQSYMYYVFGRQRYYKSETFFITNKTDNG